MPSQLFKVWRAPEAAPVSPQHIGRILSVERDDTEWDVQEVEMIPARIVSVAVAAALTRDPKESSRRRRYRKGDAE